MKTIILEEYVDTIYRAKRKMIAEGCTPTYILLNPSRKSKLKGITNILGIPISYSSQIPKNNAYLIDSNTFELKGGGSVDI